MPAIGTFMDMRDGSEKDSGIGPVHTVERAFPVGYSKQASRHLLE